MTKNLAAKIKNYRSQCRQYVSKLRHELKDEVEFSQAHRLMHFCMLVCRSFVKNRCPVRAGALTFSTLLAMIPLLAIAISVSTSILKGQGEEPIQQLIERFVEYVAPQLDLVPFETEGDLSGQEKVVSQIHTFIKNIQTGTLGVTGMIALMFVAISMLITIESTFNDIWGVPQGRSWMSRVVQYWSALTLGTIFIITAVTLTTGTQIKVVSQWLDFMPFLKALVSLFPFVVVSAAFALLYLLMPNTRVKLKSAFVGGIIGGCLWQLNSMSNVVFVSRVMRDTNIYDSFAVLPVFMLGLYLSWLILLFGAQVAFAHQYQLVYVEEKEVEQVNERGREFAALRLMTFIGIRFHAGQPAPTITELAAELQMPAQLIRQVLEILKEARLVQAVVKIERGYTPGRPLDKITCEDILDGMRSGVGHEIETAEGPERALLRDQFEKIHEAEAQVGNSVTLESLVKQALQCREDEAQLPDAAKGRAGKAAAGAPPHPAHSKLGTGWSFF